MAPSRMSRSLAGCRSAASANDRSFARAVAAACRICTPPTATPVLPPVALVGRKRGIALDQIDAFGPDAQLLGDHLPDRGARAGAEIDLAGENGDSAVGAMAR